MRRWLTAILLLFPILSGAAPKSEYYRHFYLDPVSHTYLGQYPVNEQICATAICARFSYDEKGRVSKIENLLPAEANIENPFMQMRFDYLRGALKVSYLNSRGIPTNNRHGVYIEWFDLDSQGRVVSHAYLDRWGKPVENEFGVAKTIYTLDERGLPASAVSWGKTESVVAKVKYTIKFDEQGNLSEISYDIDQVLTTVPGTKLTMVSLQYEETQPVGQFHIEFGEGGTRSNLESGIAVVRFDESINPIEMSWHGKGGELEESKITGLAYVRNSFDEAGNLVETDYFGANDLPKHSKKEEVSSIKMKYDAAGNLIEINSYGLDGKLETNKETGAATEKYIYNSKELSLEKRYFNEKGKPAKSKKYDAAIVRSKYDSRGEILERSVFSKEGKPAYRKLRPIHTDRYAYDDQGDCLETRYFLKDRPVEDVDSHISIIKRVFNGEGMEIGTSYYGRDGKLKNRKDTLVAGVKREFDNQGNSIHEIYYGQDNKLKKYRGPTYREAAEYTFIYDSRGLLAGLNMTDEFGEPVR